MSLDPQVAAVLQLVQDAGRPELCELSPPRARAQFDQTFPVLDLEPEPVHRFEAIEIPGPAGGIGANVYLPSDAPDLPVLMYVHGGGFVVGNPDSYDRLTRQLCNKTGAIVVSIDYRLAPEHPFPAAVEDTVAALDWLAGAAPGLGGDPARLAIGGDSAGGNLSAVAALQARDAGGPPLVFQLLVYPAVAPAPDSESHRAFADGYLLTRRNILWFLGNYAGDESRRRDPDYAPILADDLADLPPALVIVAGFDPLRDEGIAYAERLRQAGNAVELINYEGMVHGFFNMSGAVDVSRQAVDTACARLRRAFGAAP